ncbi:MAG: hypothetical protein LBS60_01275 [Deltaproteobacteria bacterium]|jgi:nucleoside phosphorylase|nr:hypothetical protein [Deltaproteobacteria bacterium]
MSYVLIVTATPGEFRGLKSKLSEFRSRNFTLRLEESGMGKINAALWLAQILSTGPKPDIVIGAGTTGCLDLTLKTGDVLATNEVIIADWLQAGDDFVHYAPYGAIDYGEPTAKVSQMVLSCSSPLVLKLLETLGDSFQKGRILSSDTFICDRKKKLDMGATFGCRVCEMEAGAVAMTAKRLGNIPWAQVKVVAEGLDEGFTDYVKMEKDIVQILANKTFEALTVLDHIWLEMKAKEPKKSGKV